MKLSLNQIISERKRKSDGIGSSVRVLHDLLDIAWRKSGSHSFAAMAKWERSLFGGTQDKKTLKPFAKKKPRGLILGFSVEFYIGKAENLGDSTFRTRIPDNTFSCQWVAKALIVESNSEPTRSFVVT